MPVVEAISTRRDAALPYPVIQDHQVHDCKVAIVDRPGLTHENLEGYDAFVTNLPGVAIGVRTADCIPVLLYDSGKHVMAAVHAGWKGRCWWSASEKPASRWIGSGVFAAAPSPSARPSTYPRRSMTANG